jgi:uncharacterized protein YecT (DUF1311 family)
MVFVGIGFTGEKEKQHSIDAWLEKCIASDSSTKGMTNCAIETTTMWDKEMNRVYKELMKKLPEKQKILLKQSQTRWLKFRDAEFNFISEFYGAFEGTIWQNILTGEKLNVVKKRTLNLQVYLNYLKENR